MTITLLVLCDTDAAAEPWRSRAVRFEGVRVEACAGREAWSARIRDTIAAADDVVAVCRQQAWLQDRFFDAARSVADDLDRDYPNWSLCGDAGVAPDGSHRYHHIKDDRRGPVPGYRPAPVIALDGNVILVNAKRWVEKGVTLPALADFDALALGASLEGLLHGLLPLADARLASVVAGTEGSERSDPADCEPFVEYLRSYVERLPGADASGANVGLYDRLARIAGASLQARLLSLFDASLVTSRGGRKPSVVIGCRTQLDRPALLDRAVASFAEAARAAGELATVGVRILSDLPEAQIAPEVARLRAMHPSLELDGWHIAARDKRLSRVDLLLGAIRRADSDFIWFVDDDDFVYAGGACALARALTAGAPQLVIGNSSVFEETWQHDGAGLRLDAATLKYRRSASDVYRALFENNTPVCSMVMPVATAQSRIDGVQAAGEYYEDYLLLLLLLTAPDVELELVDADFCGISLRQGENTVTAPDRTVWNESLANVLADALPRGGCTFPWRLSARARDEASNLTADLARALRERDYARAQFADESRRLADETSRHQDTAARLGETAAQLAHAHIRLADADTRLADADTRLAGAHARLADTTRELQSATAGLIDMSARLQATEHELNRVVSSRCWVWTAPLRDAAAWLRRCSQRLKGEREAPPR